MKHVEKMLDRMPSSRRAVRVAVAALIVVILGLIGLLFWQVHQVSGVADANAAVARARGQALGTANAKLTQNGIPAVPQPSPKATQGVTDVGPTTPSSTPKAEQGLKGDQGETGAQGPGPTSAQVHQAVVAYCDEHDDCQGKPTQAQVAAAVLTYCKGDACDGPAGKAGATGAPGKDATGEPGPSGASGEPGRAPTADEISAAVAAYCADGACKGSKGDTGPAGPAGPAGSDGKDGAAAPRFTKIECTADNTWSFQLSDGTALSAAGPCRAETVTTTVTAPPSSEPSSTSQP